jgi:N-acetylmuramoyl-L-alanine amidase
VIVIDPGHSRTISATDPATGLDVSDYENEPEMRDVFAVAQLVRSALVARGYRVIMTKTSLDQRRSLGQRAAIARDAHADLALSIHDQAGSNGGIGFRAGNNTVYYQSVGTYRSTASGKRIYFTDSSLARTSERYGATFAAQRQRVEGTSIRLLGSTGYDLGGRGLAGGDIWMVQLLSHVPWIYNESGGNSAGQVGLDAADRATYAAALVAGVEHCIAPPH